MRKLLSEVYKQSFSVKNTFLDWWCFHYAQACTAYQCTLWRDIFADVWYRQTANDLW